jgi:hypothetical protein
MVEMRVILVVVGLLAIPANLAAGPLERVARVKPVSASAERCEIIDSGLYRPSTAPVRFTDATSVTGERFEIDEVEFTRQTRSIPMELGKGFGIRYRLRGLPKNKQVDVRWRVLYPKPGIRGEASWEHGLREATADGTLVHHLLYDFHYAWEMVPGAWTFEVTVDGAPACSVVFQVR